MGCLAGMGMCSGHGQDLAPQKVDSDAHSALARLLGFLHGPLPLLELRPLLLNRTYRSYALPRHIATVIWTPCEADADKQADRRAWPPDSLQDMTRQ